ncbi:MAG: hypothetical protein K0R38_7420 [Polyangiaceae bacterium]|nr:hypothetical protein [Polyangiaceae bacterium]
MVAGWGALVLLLTSCAIGPTRGIPLYAGERRPPETVATLRGPVLTVDGKSVSSRERSFELLPGCHVIVSGGSVGHGADREAWLAHLPTTVFALRMQPGATYNVAFDIDPALGRGPIGTGQIRATERDGHGRTRRIAAVTTEAEVAACRQPSPPR